MAKSKEELDALKLEVETLNSKLKHLGEEEIKYVSGGNNNLENGEANWKELITSKGEPRWPELIGSNGDDD